MDDSGMTGERGRRIASPWALAAAPQPLLVRPFDAGITGWIVVMGALIAEVAAGIVTNSMPAAAAIPVLAFPAAVAAAVAIAQWWQVRSARAEPASWWHLGGIAAAVVTWLAYPTAPGILSPAANARAACVILQGAHVTPACLTRAATAFDHRGLAWWLTGALIAGAALLTRRSKIAAWAAIPAALGGVLIATHFLELLLLHYTSGTGA